MEPLSSEAAEQLENIVNKDESLVTTEAPKRKIRYQYVISTITSTRRRRSRVFEFEATDGWFKRFSIGLPYSFMSIILGWWGFPFGIMFTPVAIFRNTIGGEDVTFKQIDNDVVSEKFTNNSFSDK